tara:strand:- start:176 stop:370 length:195 start_codon:yes stop_codon:yes gene_type:complete
MKVGDLVKLKGFSRSHRNDVPHGIITADLGLDKFKIRWLNKEIASRWAIPVIMPSEKLELINAN